MIKRIHFLSALLLIAGCGKREPAKIIGPVERIISLAPDITETVYALELGEKLVGATTYCIYPEAAKSVPRVGGFGQFNFEAIVSLKPDLVILHEQYASEKSRLDGLGIPYIETNTRSLDEIRDAILNVGGACGVEERAAALVERIDAARASAKNHSTSRPRVLITFGSDAAAIDQIHAFGATCLHDELLTIAGGDNVVENNLPFATLSKEAIIRLNPEIIIQLAPGATTPADPVATWSALSGVDAVKHRRIHVLTGDHTCIPGPRVLQILNDFRTVLEQYE